MRALAQASTITAIDFSIVVLLFDVESCGYSFDDNQDNNIVHIRNRFSYNGLWSMESQIATDMLLKCHYVMKCIVDPYGPTS